MGGREDIFRYEVQDSGEVGLIRRALGMFCYQGPQKLRPRKERLHVISSHLDVRDREPLRPVVAAVELAQ